MKSMRFASGSWRSSARKPSRRQRSSSAWKREGGSDAPLAPLTQKSEKPRGWHRRRLSGLKSSHWIATGRLLPTALPIALSPCPSRLCLNRLLQSAKAARGLSLRQVSLFTFKPHLAPTQHLIGPTSEEPRLLQPVPQQASRSPGDASPASDEARISNSARIAALEDRQAEMEKSLEDIFGRLEKLGG
jgi:hypothetical protein